MDALAAGSVSVAGVSKGKPGRPTVEERDPEAWDTAVDALAEGYTKLEAAAIAGIGYSTLRERIDKDPALAARVAAVQARRQRRYLENIDDIADNSRDMGPRLNANIKALEMRWPDRFAKRATLTIEKKEPGEMNAAEIVSELEEELAKARALLGGGEGEDG